MKDWDELTVAERIASFPNRHPYPFKAMLYLATFVAPVPWPTVDIVMRAMGYEKMDVRLESEGLSIGAPSYYCPEEPWK